MVSAGPPPPRPSGPKSAQGRYNHSRQIGLTHPCSIKTEGFKDLASGASGVAVLMSSGPKALRASAKQIPSKSPGTAPTKLRSNSGADYRATEPCAEVRILALKALIHPPAGRFWAPSAPSAQVFPQQQALVPYSWASSGRIMGRSGIRSCRDTAQWRLKSAIWTVSLCPSTPAPAVCPEITETHRPCPTREWTSIFFYRESLLIIENEPNFFAHRSRGFKLIPACMTVL